MPESAWVIERETSSPGLPEYLSGVERGRPTWTSAGDSLSAVRFCRKQDAEKMASGMDPVLRHRSMEHLWG